LRPGDVIVGVNGRKVRDTNELLAQLRTVERPLALNLVRGDFGITLVIRA